MKSKGSYPGVDSDALRREAPLQLRIGHELVSIWFDAQGIHFQHPEGRPTEGILPWDVAMAMSLLPGDGRRPVNTPAA
jgi:hypothetical protein